MKTLKQWFTVGAVLIVSLSVHGFRSHQSSGEKIITQAEDQFRVESQIEHYQTLIIKPDLSLIKGDLVLAYHYEGDEVYGIVHLMPNEDSLGYTVLSHQEKDEVPRIYYWEPGFTEVRELRASDWRGTVGGTPWNFEDMLDDDKENWSYVNKGIQYVDGIEANMIESYYVDPVLKRRSAYSKRNTYVARDDKRFLKSIYYNRAGEPTKTLYANLHNNIGTEDSPLIRAKRIHIVEHGTGLATVLQVEEASYNIPLPKAFFEVSSLPSWGEKQLPRALELARGN